MQWRQIVYKQLTTIFVAVLDLLQPIDEMDQALSFLKVEAR